MNQNVPQPDTPPAPHQSDSFTASNAPTSPAPGSAEQLLLQLGVRRSVAHQLADLPLAQVERVIAQTRARQGVHDVAGWVVSALRDLPATEAPPPPRVSETTIQFHPGISGRERQIWLARFRGASSIEQPTILARFLAEHPLEEPHATAV